MTPRMMAGGITRTPESAAAEWNRDRASEAPKTSWLKLPSSDRKLARFLSTSSSSAKPTIPVWLMASKTTSAANSSTGSALSSATVAPTEAARARPASSSGNGSLPTFSRWTHRATRPYRSQKSMN